MSVVKESGVAADQNRPHRRRMEDAHTLIDKFTFLLIPASEAKMPTLPSLMAILGKMPLHFVGRIYTRFQHVLFF